MKAQKPTPASSITTIEGKIHFIRGHKVILDRDLAELYGALMAANVLRSRRAIQMSVLIVQTFVRLQRMVVSADALSRKFEELERATNENRDQIKQMMPFPA